MAYPNPICVLVMKSDVVLKRAIASLMMRKMDLDVVISEADNAETLDMDLTLMKPDVLVLNDSLALADERQLASLMARHAGLKIVVVSMYSNRLHVVGREEISVKSLDDLLSVLITA